jgi:hypothetical protein
MVVEIAKVCSGGCGVRVTGQLDAETREFFHRFTLPRGAEQLFKPPKTEVEKVQLVTFGPNVRVWSVECPVCRQAIPIVTRDT